MSEPQKPTGNTSVFSGTVKGERAANFEESFMPEADQEGTVEVAAEEAVQEEVKASEEAAVEATEESPEGDEAARLVEDVKKRIQEQSQAPATPQVSPEMARMEGRLQELKDQIVQMAKAQDVPKPEEGFDFSALDDPGVRAQIEAAWESDDPVDKMKAQAVIAREVLRAEGGQDVEALKQELETLKQSSIQQQHMLQSREMFNAGLEAASKMGKVEAALVEDFKQSQELDHWNAHLTQQLNAGQKPSLDGYAPRSVLGLWLMNKPMFAATPELMQAGTSLLAKELASTASQQAEVASTTGAGVRAKAPAKPTSNEEEATPEEAILQGIEAANKKRKSKGAAFG